MYVTKVNGYYICVKYSWEQVVGFISKIRKQWKSSNEIVSAITFYIYTFESQVYILAFCSRSKSTCWKAELIETVHFIKEPGTAMTVFW